MFVSYVCVYVKRELKIVRDDIIKYYQEIWKARVYSGSAFTNHSHYLLHIITGGV